MLALLSSYAALVRDIKQVYGTIRQTQAKPLPSVGWEDLHRGPQKAVHRLHPHRVEMRVVKVRRETPSTKTFCLEATEGSLTTFIPGQYVSLFIDKDNLKTSRPLSISSPPNGKGLMELTVRRKTPGLVSSYMLDQVKADDTLTLSSPEGNFHYLPARDTRDVIFIAGGTGITPFMGMTEHLLKEIPDIRIQLFYGSRRSDDIIFHSRLASLAAQYSRFKMNLIIEEPSPDWEGETGRIDAPFLFRHFQPERLAGQTFFLCGPRQMVDSIEESLLGMGVRKQRIRRDITEAPDDITEALGWPVAHSPDQMVKVQLDGRNESIQARSGESLMTALERSGIVMPSQCRSGVCAVCRSKLVSGEVFTPDFVTLRQTDTKAGFIHPCQSYPLTNLVLRLP